MIKFQGLTDFALFVHLRIKLKAKSHFLIYCNKYSILRKNNYEKIEHIIPTFRQQATNELMTSSNHYINLHLTKHISSCFDTQYSTLKSNQCNLDS